MDPTGPPVPTDQWPCLTLRQNSQLSSLDSSICHAFQKSKKIQRSVKIARPIPQHRTTKLTVLLDSSAPNFEISRPLAVAGTARVAGTCSSISSRCCRNLQQHIPPGLSYFSFPLRLIQRLLYCSMSCRESVVFAYHLLLDATPRSSPVKARAGGCSRYQGLLLHHVTLLFLPLLAGRHPI